MTTPVDIDKLKELLPKATALPWEESDGERGPNFYLEIRGPYDGDVNGDTGQHIVVGGEPICSFLDNERDYQDCALVIAAVNSLPALIAKAERVDALMDLVRRAQLNVPQYYVEWHEAARNALSPKESE